MKSTKTVLAVAIVIAGFAYAANAFPPGGQSKSNCCGPQPEDFRSYHIDGPGIIIPSVEGKTGMIITDMTCWTPTLTRPVTCSLSGPIARPLTYITLSLNSPGGERSKSVHFQSGIPVPAGAKILQGGESAFVTISGYVY